MNEQTKNDLPLGGEDDLPFGDIWGLERVTQVRAYQDERNREVAGHFGDR